MKNSRISDQMMGFANEINEFGSFGIKGASECHNFGSTWGFRPDCPVFERGKCQQQEENEEQFISEGLI
jgi:hypothetical protein